MSWFDSFFMLVIAGGVLGTAVAELMPYAIRVAGQVSSLEVFAAGFQVFVSFFARFFLLLVAPLCGFAFESKILVLSQIKFALGFSYVASLCAILIYFYFLDKIFIFFSSYIRIAEPTNTYFRPRIPIQAVGLLIKGGANGFKINMLRKERLGCEINRKFLLGSFLAGAFSSAIIPVVVVLALSFPSYRLTIFAFGPLVTFIGSFSNVVLVEKTLALNSQREIPNAQLAGQLRTGRLAGVIFSFLIFISLSRVSFF